MSDLKITVKSDRLLKDFDDFIRHIDKNIDRAVDDHLDKAVEELKAVLKRYINEGIRVNDTVPAGRKVLPEKLNMPITRVELIKQVFGEDFTKSNFFRAYKGDSTVSDTSNVFVVKNKRLKVWQSVSDSSSFAADYQRFKDRLRQGIIIDDNGKIFKFDPDHIKGVKLECSRVTGEDIGNANRFEAYKNSSGISRRGNSPEQRVAVWTIKQDDLMEMMRGALPLDGILDAINNGDHELARNVLEYHNKSGHFNDAISNLDDLQADREIVPNTEAYNNAMNLINNLKISKRIGQEVTTYTLFSRYNDDVVEGFEKFFDAIRSEITMWIVTNEDRWFQAVVNAVDRAIQKYDPKAKFV